MRQHPKHSTGHFTAPIELLISQKGDPLNLSGENAVHIDSSHICSTHTRAEKLQPSSDE